MIDITVDAMTAYIASAVHRIEENEKKAKEEKNKKKTIPFIDDREVTLKISDQTLQKIMKRKREGADRILRSWYLKRLKRNIIQNNHLDQKIYQSSVSRT